MAGSAQLLLNGDMEAGTATPDVWWTGGTPGQDFELGWADGVAATGSRSLTVRDANGATDSFAFWAQSLDIANPVGMTFELSASIKLNGVTGEGLSIAIRGDDLSLNNGSAEVFATTQGHMAIDGTQDWTTYTVELSLLPAEIDRITVFFVYLPTNTGTAHFDDAILSVSQTVPTLELQNTSAENGASRPDDWWHGGRGQGSYDFAWSDTQASSGLRSLGVGRVDESAAEFGFWAQTIDATNFAGGSAELTVRIRSTGLAGQGAAIAIRIDDTPRPQGFAEAFATTQGNRSIIGSGGWKMYNVSLRSVPADARSVTVYLIHLTGTSGSVYFDEMSLVGG